MHINQMRGVCALMPCASAPLQVLLLGELLQGRGHVVSGGSDRPNHTNIGGYELRLRPACRCCGHDLTPSCAVGTERRLCPGKFSSAATNQEIDLNVPHQTQFADLVKVNDVDRHVVTVCCTKMLPAWMSLW
jgi:hypothetical protein